MSNKSILFCLVVFICCMGCNKSKETNSRPSSENTITIVKPEVSPLHIQQDISALLDTVKFIKLEQTEASVIGEISKAIFYQNRIYIFDIQTSSIYIYDENGNYQSKIARQGHGPEEYIQLDFFDIDYEKQQLVLTDLMGYWTFRYDLKGNFLTRKKIPFWIEGIAAGANQGYVTYANYRDNKHQFNQEYNLCYLDSSMQQIAAFFPYSSSNYNNPKIRFGTPQAGPFYSFEKQNYFYFPHTADIYRIGKNSLKQVYSIDFGEKGFNRSLMGDNKQLEKYLDEGNFFNLANVTENKDFLIFSFYQENMRIGYTCYYSKKSGHTLCSPGFTVGNGNYFNGVPITTYDSWIVASVETTELLSWKQDLNKQFPLSSSYAKQKLQISNNLKLTDNNVLMLYKLKQF